MRLCGKNICIPHISALGIVIQIPAVRAVGIDAINQVIIRCFIQRRILVSCRLLSGRKRQCCLGKSCRDFFPRAADKYDKIIPNAGIFKTLCHILLFIIIIKSRRAFTVCIFHINKMYAAGSAVKRVVAAASYLKGAFPECRRNILRRSAIREIA